MSYSVKTYIGIPNNLSTDNGVSTLKTGGLLGLAPRHKH